MDGNDADFSDEDVPAAPGTDRKLQQESDSSQVEEIKNLNSRKLHGLQPEQVNNYVYPTFESYDDLWD